MKATVSVLGITLSLNAFILPVCLTLYAAGGCTGVSTEPVKSINTVGIPNTPVELTAGGSAEVSTEPGKSVNPADLSNAHSEITVEPRFAPNPYTDDVIKLKQKMRDSEDK
ncbi:MAG: hypothetical protein HZB37_08335 [Planctomycetes bacterium]|nr:hypothetical protein [Planctomycetota bacterium]